MEIDNFLKTFKMKTLLIFASVVAIGIVIGYYTIVETLPEDL